MVHYLTGKQCIDYRGVKISEKFPDIIVSTKHSYEIDYKYEYECSNSACFARFGRQKKLDLMKMVCGACQNRILQVKPAMKESGKERKNPFGEVVREHFKDVRNKNKGLSHKDIMGFLSSMYKETKKNEEKNGGRVVV